MELNVHISFFRVHQCGYYANGSPQPVIANFLEVLRDMSQWTIENELRTRQTATFSRDPQNGILPVYLMEIHADSGWSQAVLVTWNETETMEGAFASLDGDSPVGSASVDQMQVPAGGIPGYPTYFWLLPRDNLFATIRLDPTRMNGHEGLKRYVRGFMSTHASYAVFDDAHKTVLGYRAPGEALRRDVHPRFRTASVRRPAPLEMIRNRRDSISRLHRKKVIQIADPVDRSLFNAFLRSIGIGQIAARTDDIHFWSSMEFTPTAEQLEEIFHQSGREDAAMWGDIGIEFQGEPKVHWLSKTLASVRTSLDIPRQSSGLFSARDLLDALSPRRAWLAPEASHQP